MNGESQTYEPVWPGKRIFDGELRLRFNETYNVHCELTLASGRVVALDALLQQRTYDGLQAGTPDKNSNDQLLKWHLRGARHLPGAVGAPHLLAPPRRDYRVTPGDMQDVLDRQTGRPPEMLHVPEWLPEVYSTGVFRSHSPAHDRDKDFSTLTLLWYQADFGVDAGAMQAIRLIDWNSYATDLEW